MPTSSTSRSSLNRGHAHRQAGFTLIEVIVTTAIMVLIMGIVLANQSEYSQATLLNNTVVDASLVVREAQVSGVSVREYQAGSDNFNAAYGARFAVDEGYYFFADLPPRNGYYDGGACVIGPGSECLAYTDTPTGVRVSSICSISASSGETCNVGRVDITFVRPETDAHFFFWDTSGIQISMPDVTGMKIVFQNAAGTQKSVVVYTTGQISVQ